MPLQRWRHQQPFDAVTLQQSNPLVRTERERRSRKRIGEHRGRRHDCDAGQHGCVPPAPRIDDVISTAACTSTFVVARRADRAVRDADGVDELAIASRMPDAYGPGRAIDATSSEEQVPARVDGEAGE